MGYTWDMTSAPHLIAEDLLLLLLDDETGKMAASTYEKSVLGGALLAELGLVRAVEVEKGAGVFGRQAVVVTADTAPSDPLLASALETVAEKPRSPGDLVDRLGKGLKARLTDRLVERGLLERRDGKVLGLFPTTTWPARDSAHEDAVRRQLQAALGGGIDPDERTATLVALLHAVDVVPKVLAVEGMRRGELKKRAKEIADGDWAAKAVKDAVAASTAAMTAAIAAGGAAASSS